MISTHPLKIILALLLFTLAYPASAQTFKTYKLHLEGIADGDTIYVRNLEARTSFRVRLAMIDAPESSQEYGQQSKALLTQLLRGAGKISIDVYDTDRYGRPVAIVRNEQGQNVNFAMVAQGAAWVYHKYAKGRRYGDLYAPLDSAEKSAQINQMGLWRSLDPVEPWRFRRAQ